MIPVFQTAFYNISSMLACCLLFIFASWKNEKIEKTTIVVLGIMIAQSYMIGLAIALFLAAFITAFFL